MERRRSSSEASPPASPVALHGPRCLPSRRVVEPPEPEAPWEPAASGPEAHPSSPGPRPASADPRRREEALLCLELLVGQLQAGLAALRGSLAGDGAHAVSEPPKGAAAVVAETWRVPALGDRRGPRGDVPDDAQGGAPAGEKEFRASVGSGGVASSSGSLPPAAPTAAPETQRAVSPKNGPQHSHRVTSYMVTDIMDHGSLKTWSSGLRSGMPSCSWKSAFGAIGCAVIIAHSMCLGLGMEYSLQGRESALLGTLNHIFLGYYVAELIALLYLDGYRKCFIDRWFYFDACLVVIGVLSQWVAPLLGGGDKELESALTFRILRLCRLLRFVRVLENCPDLWMLSCGILRSTRTVLNAFFLIMVTLYVFAIVGVEAVTKQGSLREADGTVDLVEQKFDSVLGVLLTLVQFTNADSLAAFYEPLIREQPSLALYFGSVWVAVTIMLMNLVTAVIVQNAIHLGAEEEETLAKIKRKKLEKLLPLLIEIFDAADVSNDGRLQMNEVEELCQLPLPPELAECMEPERMKHLFRCLDEDGSGDISLDEFLTGVCHIALSGVSIETVQILSMLRSQGRILDELELKLTGRRVSSRRSGVMHPVASLQSIRSRHFLI